MNRMTSGFKWLLAAGAVAAVAAMPARAADSMLYLKLDAGVNLLQDIDVDFGQGKFPAEMDPGFRFDLIAGYKVNEFASLEVESGFIYNSADVMEEDYEEADNEPWLGAVPLMMNIVARFENESPWVPYVGIGGGGALGILDDGYDTDTDLVLAWQVFGGLAYKFSEDMSVNAGYKLFSATSQEYEMADVDETYNHFIGLSFLWNF